MAWLPNKWFITSLTVSFWSFSVVILVSEVMNVPMRLQKQLSAQQSHLWSARPLISPQSLLSTIVKCGRLNGTDALLINCTLSNLNLVTAASHISLAVMLLFWEDYALVTNALLINIYSLAIVNHSVTNVNALYNSQTYPTGMLSSEGCPWKVLHVQLA